MVAGANISPPVEVPGSLALSEWASGGLTALFVTYWFGAHLHSPYRLEAEGWRELPRWDWPMAEAVALTHDPAGRPVVVLGQEQHTTQLRVLRAHAAGWEVLREHELRGGVEGVAALWTEQGLLLGWSESIPAFDGRVGPPPTCQLVIYEVTR